MSYLLVGSQQRQRRILITVGAATIAAMLLAAAIALRLPDRSTPETIHLTLATPDVGQGVRIGSKVILHGVPVGEVDAVTTEDHGVELAIRLQRNAVDGVTDAFDFDYRPVNYFGVTVVNLRPHGGGRPLADGQRITRAAEGDYTMAAMLDRSSVIVNGVVTDRMMDVLRRTADYATGLAPLIETGFIATNAIAETQRRLPSDQLRSLDAVLDPLPGFADAAITGTTAIRAMPSGHEVVDNFGPMNETMQLIATGFFGPLGALLGSHAGDFTPSTEMVRALSDAMGQSMAKARGGDRLQALLAGLDSAYSGPDGDKALRVRVVLDSLPALASALPLPPGGPR
ncbi:ABC-type transporter Mla subunit MlaD [Nocardia pseudobrasiliensis]|uniref:ABC-type transporter Mla subunit MlaD n=2 Tax=Nocardia pseudobrasiliensis TaxID=45979 RepID=A0A370IE06_9NOCA|nr:ABC-type transporter Mla subunit MlaD [Nocardia pseudobrasiliensis]